MTGEVLDSVTISDFNGGKWLTFLVRGNVNFVFVWISGQDAVFSGLFIDPYTGPEQGAPGPAEQFVAEPVSGRLLRSVGTTSQAVPVARQFHQDALGSVETVSRAAGSGSGAAGSVEGDYRLDAFGNALPGTATDYTVRDNPFTYLGGLGYWNEPDLGLSYVRARWLDTATGSWLSVDPVEGEPRYSYVRNSPAIYIDPEGRQYRQSTSGSSIFDIQNVQLSPADPRVREARRNSKEVEPGSEGFLLRKDSQGRYYLIPREHKLYTGDQWFDVTGYGLIRDVLSSLATGTSKVFDINGNRLPGDDYRLIVALQNSVNLERFTDYYLIDVGGQYRIMSANSVPLPNPKSGVIYAQGVAGPIIDEWFVQEIKSQVNGFEQWFRIRKKEYVFKPSSDVGRVRLKGFGGRYLAGPDKLVRVTSNNSAPSEIELLDWANGNELYKFSEWFPFTGKFRGVIATRDPKALAGGETTVTLFNKVMSRATLGNIVYGFIAGYAGWSREHTRSAPTIWKKKGGIIVSIDPYDEYAYTMGWDMLQYIQRQGYMLPTENKKYVPDQVLRAAFNNALAKNPDALRETRNINGNNLAVDYSKLRKPAISTGLTFHGGLVGAIAAPRPTGEDEAKAFKEQFDKLPAKP